MEYIHNNYEKTLTIDMLCKMACMSPTKFKTIFKNIAGVPIAKYIMQVRMQAAQNLLKQNDNSILEIAQSVGYVKASAFSNVYRTFFGQLPT